MPFDKKSGAVAGKKGSGKRWEDKAPATKRTIQVPIRVSPAEREMLDDKARRAGVNRTGLIMLAVEAYEPEAELKEKIESEDKKK